MGSPDGSPRYSDDTPRKPRVTRVAFTDDPKVDVGQDLQREKDPMGQLREKDAGQDLQGEKDAMGQLQDDLQEREEEVLEQTILTQRIDTLQKTLASKNMTIESQRQTISYQEAQIRRLRDTIYLLRANVAELSDCMKHNFVNLPHTTQELPPVDEALENWRHYEKKTREEVAKELEDLMAEYTMHSALDADRPVSSAKTTRKHVAQEAKNTRKSASKTRRSQLDSDEAVKPTKPDTAVPTKTRKTRYDFAGIFANLSLKKPEEQKPSDARTPSHPSARGKSDKMVNVRAEVSREDNDETPANIVSDKDQTFDKTFACDMVPMVRAILKCQFQRETYNRVLTYLLGKKALFLFEDKFTQMLIETVCACIASRNVGYHHDLRQFMPQWLQMLVNLTESERGTLFTYDEDAGELYSRVLTGSFKAPIRIQKGTGVVGHVFESGTPVIVNDCYDDLRFNPTFDRRTGLRSQSILCAPILSGPRIVGVLELFNKKTTYNSDDLKLIEVLGTVIAPGLTSSKVHRVLKKHHAEEARMIKQTVSNDKDRLMSPLVREIMKCVSSILSTERCTLFLSDSDRGKLWAIVSQGLDNIHIEIPDNRGIAGAVFTNNLIVNIPDCYNDPRFNQAIDKESGFHTRTMLCAPIAHAVSGKPIGVIQAINKIGGVFTQSDEQRMEQLTCMVASILITSDSLEELTVGAELNERIYQCLSVATVVLNSSGNCVKVNRDAADLFFLENSAQWTGRHAAEIFGQTNPTVYHMWTQCVESAEEQTSDCLPIYPFVGEAEGDSRSCRVIPFTNGELIGTVVTFTPTYVPKS